MPAPRWRCVTDAVHCLAILLLLAVGTAAAAEHIRVVDAWARATPPGVGTGAAYFTIHGGATDDRLLGVESDVSSSIEMHRVSEDDGMMRMRPVDAVDVPAHSTVAFAPGGLHLMLLGLKAPLVAGTHFQMVLVFATAGRVPVEVEVRPPG